MSASVSAPVSWKFLRPRPWPAGHVRPPKYQAHRGYWVEGAAQNTLEAFRAARAKGYEMAELDVRLSKDAVPVVFHDPDLRKFGRNVHVLDLTAQEIGRLTGAPTLEEVLTMEESPASFNVELKGDFANAAALEVHVARVIERTGAASRVMFSSFSPISLVTLSRLLPEGPRALLASREKEEGNSLYLREMWLAPVLPIHMLNLDERSLDEGALGVLRERGIPFSVWTVNEVARAEELLEAGAGSVITDSILPGGV